MDMKIAVIYHSGSGSTRTVSEVMTDKLSRYCTTSLIPINPDFDYPSLNTYDFLLFGFPTYSCLPSQSMLEFIDSMPVLTAVKNAVVFTTCSLYTGNAIRIMVKKLALKNIITTMFFKVNGPASDAALIISNPPSFLLRYEKKAGKKIDDAVSYIIGANSEPSEKPIIPFYKWYVPLNKALIYFAEKKYHTYRDTMEVIDERCTNCNTCVTNCIRGGWTGSNTKPEFNASLCELCLKCVHNCPENAIIFSEKMKDNHRLNRKSYNELKRLFPS